MLKRSTVIAPSFARTPVPATPTPAPTLGTRSPTVLIMDIVDDDEAAAWDAQMARLGFRS